MSLLANALKSCFKPAVRLPILTEMLVRTKTKKSCFPKPPECVRGSIAKLKCAKVKHPEYKPKPTSPEKSAWTFEPDFQDPPDRGEYLPLFDWLYYRTSDKAKRKYQKTWADCPGVRRRKKCCDLTKIPKSPPWKKRKSKKMTSKTNACECNKTKFEFICKKKSKHPCPYQDMPGCKRGRRPPTCKSDRGLKKCDKYCCPYPSYSECCQAQPAKLPGRPPECFCLVPPPMCIVYREMRKYRRFKK